jgi:hypothetical protein
MLSRRIAASVGTLAVAAAMTGLTTTSAIAATGSASAAPPAFNTGQIHVRGRCLSDLSDSSTPGNPVQVATCTTQLRQQWTLDADGTVRIGGHAGTACLGLSSGEVAQIVACTDPSADWFPQADKELVNLGSGTAQARNCLYTKSSTPGTALVERACTAGWVGEELTIPNTTYAVSSLTYRPDSGGSGGNWALDSMARDASVTYLGGTAGAYTYEGSIVDNGTFVTIPGNDTPNQTMDPGLTVGDSLTGSIVGQWGFSFTATNAASTTPPAAIQGVRDDTGTWNELFFSPATTFGGTGGLSSGPEQWSWSYVTAKDNCGNTETWTDANNNNGGQVAQANGGTDITAPAPGATCPA